MVINWPLVAVLVGLSLPGILIVVPRIIDLLLPDNSPEIKSRISRFAMLQNLVMVLMMSLAGSVLSTKTGLKAPLLSAVLGGEAGIGQLGLLIVPALLFAVFGIFTFYGLYFGVLLKRMDPENYKIAEKMRAVIGLDGAVLYSGLFEEVIARWGLMNLSAFMILIFVPKGFDGLFWIAAMVGGTLFALGQLPLLVAAGAKPSRRFLYLFMGMGVVQSLFFGYLFWQYGLEMAVIVHMLMHLGGQLASNALKKNRLL